jgi:hypothetical protein
MKIEMTKEEFPFPVKAVYLMMRIHSQKWLEKEEYDILSDLLERYLSLRAEVFHEN